MPRQRFQQEVEEHWKVRVHLPSGIIYLASKTKPKLITTDGKVTGMDWVPVGDKSELGDTLLLITWSRVTAVSYRYQPAVVEEPEPKKAVDFKLGRD